MPTPSITDTPLEIKQPNYSPEEKKQIGAILARLIKARDDRDKKHPELNNLTYREYYEENERIANTFIEKKTIDQDIVIASGTVEQKLFTIAAEINRLNLSAEVRVFDKYDNEMITLGWGLSDIMEKTEEVEKDSENKLIRQVELYKQGTVFIQENWVCEYKYEKDRVEKDKIGKIKDIPAFQAKLKKVFEGPRRQILYAPGVYLGNIREFQMFRQPFIYTHKITSYSEAMSRYGGKDAEGKPIWERWANVPTTRVSAATIETIESLKVNDGFALTDLKENMVEEIHYQDRFNDEYQIFLNGVAMLPVGFPLSAISPGGEYNIEKQVLQVINPFFAYGRSFVARTKEQADLLDEVLRLLILKTRKSIHPPYANISGKVISARSLMPGRISMGIDPGSLVPIGTEGQGATASEYQMLKELRDAIDRVTVSPQIQGQAGQSGTTAFEVNLLQRQAQKVLSLIVFAASLLEQKIGYLRMNNILANYFNPIDTVVDEARGELKSVYRQTTVRKNIEGRGQGIRKVIPMTGKLPSSEEMMDAEDFYDTPEPAEGERRRTREELGMEPVQFIALNPDELRAANLIFHVQVDAREKDSSSQAKLMFREELRDIALLAQFGSVPNVAELEERYAAIWNVRKNKLFVPREQAQQMLAAQANGGIGNENAAGVSTVGGPSSAESAMIAE